MIDSMTGHYHARGDAELHYHRCSRCANAIPCARDHAGALGVITFCDTCVSRMDPKWYESMLKARKEDDDHATH